MLLTGRMPNHFSKPVIGAVSRRVGVPTQRAAQGTPPLAGLSAALPLLQFVCVGLCCDVE